MIPHDVVLHYRMNVYTIEFPKNCLKQCKCALHLPFNRNRGRHRTAATSGLPLQSSRELAKSRQRESELPNPVLIDKYAASLVATGPPTALDPMLQNQHSIATRYIDELLMSAMSATSLNRIAQGDYRQVVLLADGMDTRPFRMNWPEGTIMFLIAPSECHELAEAVLKQVGATVPRGCMLRRVNADLLRSNATLGSDLEACGFRPDRLSVWALQGLSGLGLGVTEVTGLLADITSVAAFNSLVFGELPHMSRDDATNMLADCGLLGAVLEHEEALGILKPDSCLQLNNQGNLIAQGDFVQTSKWLFSSQQLRLSLAQMGVFERHSKEAEDVDEDFFGNFS
ncbi:hypothetical protein CEUSTIGMA_g11411.t1 [Chlamydomonas eustigma]|uniref:S-adenosyl-L-methionine-dependent methyltransferase n=1 Tax=Chlamydomonas eustigma TaxID=1157962 RepID=A0A250XLS4_9CHLO|nr:hypothetical protein CEUSTIGMA_g11411.t1 [Chlamydomonas eustigma]|eukprot:GAX83986.1 hypothetical protein CEUSTIGMA_g11411.t1 [Chlamydomonas eustigma]